MNQKFLEEMLKTPSVSGHEEVLQRKVIDYMQDTRDALMTDAVGNVINVINPDNPFKIMLCGHIDEIGLIVSHIDESGFIKAAKCGGISAFRYLGTQVQITTKSGIVYGVVITTRSLEKKDSLGADELTIDIGACSKEDAANKVSIGDPICAATDMLPLMNHRLAARAMDDRIGAFIILEALRKAKEKGCKHGVYAATTVGEETTMRGAYWASHKVKPDLAIIVDVTYTSDYPGVSPVETGAVSLGKGGVLCHSSLNSKILNQQLEDTAKKHHISYQWEIAPGRAGTDGDVVSMSNDGVVIALVSIPLRYMHSSIETCSLDDVESMIEWLACFLCEVDEHTSYDPYK